jgi:hypothetical protein
MVPARSRPASPRAPVAVAARVACSPQLHLRCWNRTRSHCTACIVTRTPPGPSAPPGRVRACHEAPSTTRCTIRDGWRGVLNRIFLSNHNAIVACTATCDRPHSIRRVQAQHHLNLRLPLATMESSIVRTAWPWSSSQVHACMSV